MFNQQELQILIGGIEEPVDVEDLMQNAVYGGVYDTDHVVIQRFWKVGSPYSSATRSPKIRQTLWTIALPYQ